MTIQHFTRRAWSLLPAISTAILLVACGNSGTNETTSDTTHTMTDSMHAAMTEDTASVPMVKQAEAMLSGTFADTTVNGTAKFEAEDNGKVKMELELTIPAKAGKSVAVHIHEHGDCGDKGSLSHGHWNPTGAQHGKWGSANFHAGDIGNVALDKNGKGTLTLETDLWTLGGSASKNILAKAIIVHGGVDDYTSQPSGNAGTRIGCGVIK